MYIFHNMVVHLDAPAVQMPMLYQGESVDEHFECGDFDHEVGGGKRDEEEQEGEEGEGEEEQESPDRSEGEGEE